MVRKTYTLAELRERVWIAEGNLDAVKWRIEHWPGHQEDLSHMQHILTYWRRKLDKAEREEGKKGVAEADRGGIAMADTEWPEHLVAQYNHHCVHHNADYEVCPDTACTAAFAEELALGLLVKDESGYVWLGEEAIDVALA